MLWDIALRDDQDRNNPNGIPGFSFGDVDGDGSLDLVTVILEAPGSRRPDHELIAVSLRDGRLIWSDRLDFRNPFQAVPQIAVADLDGDRRPEIVVTEVPAVDDKTSFGLKVLNGHDGTVRWTWNGGTPEVANIQVWAWLTLAQFGPDGRRTVCLHLSDPKGLHRILVFDENGRELCRASCPAISPST